MKSVSGKDVNCRVVRNASVPTASFAPHQINGSLEVIASLRRGVRLKISEVWAKLSTEHLSLNTTDTGPKTVLSRFRLRHFACRKSNAENIYAVKFYASLDRMINQSLFFLAKVKVAYASPSANSLHFETW